MWPEEGKKEAEIDGDEDSEAEEVARLVEGIKRDAAKRVGFGSAALLFLSRYVGKETPAFVNVFKVVFS